MDWLTLSLVLPLAVAPLLTLAGWWVGRWRRRR